ncbi:MAG: hypothetical protein HRT38_16830 [Alteromonadaceae bacterium]|nr:hypothetical protein [Alteromonadaceae bacterium]
MHYDEQRENNRIKNKSQKIKVTLPCSSSVNQHLNITWHLDEIVKATCVGMVKKPKESNE